MPNPTPSTTTVVLLATLLAAPVAAQTVLLSEVAATGADRWLEVHNRGTTTADLSNWSVYQAVETIYGQRTCWWAFPPGTVLAAGGYLRVHWYQAAPTTPVPGELYTGDTPYDFLFGLGGEPLQAVGGALGLLSSQANGMMNSSAIVRDWVSWGSHGFSREQLAITAGAWTAGVHCPAIGAGQSLARNVAVVGFVPRRDQEWFADPTPTPGGPNVVGAEVRAYGLACALPGHHLLGAPQLGVNSLPLLGNAQFRYEVRNTTGVFGESMLFVHSAGAAAPGQPSLLPSFSGASCQEAIDPAAVLASIIVPTQVVQTAVPLPLHNLPHALVGLTIHTQALVFDWLPNAWPPFQGLSNAVAVTLGQ